ncbi:hypothetical protein GCM10023195_37200 [Actinoallomurus liliacearum]|uniref:Uncharacterized protein n=1 Tax=Actinoallomurus liliacearum TaxID=1080073 RepID=A0ABP8TLQ3_9ACTN
MTLYAGISQPNQRVTRLCVVNESGSEHGDMNEVEVAVLRSYVEALGGRLRIIADFGDDSRIVT